MGFIPNAWVLAFVAPVQVVLRRFAAALGKYYEDCESVKHVAIWYQKKIRKKGKSCFKKSLYQNTVLFKIYGS